MIAFVGLGPSGPGLLPARALDLLSRATVVIAEPSIASRVESLAVAAGATLVEQAIATASEAHDAAARHAGDAEALVVRVVAGDAILRAADEIRAARALLPPSAIEIVPSVGTRSALASHAGIVFSANVRLVKAAEVKTLPPETPITRVANLGTPRQEVTEALARDFYALSEPPPSSTASPGGAVAEALIVAGAHPDPSLRWFDRRPLFGKRILVTRAMEQAGELAKLLEERGAEAYVAPSIAIHPPPDPEPLLRALRDLADGKYTWVAFTSANGVRRVADAIAKEGRDARIFSGAKVAAIGPGTARALNGIGITADLVAKEFIGEALANAIADHAPGNAADAAAVSGTTRGRILLPRARVARDAAPDLLRARGFEVDVVAAYETRAPDPTHRERLMDDLATLDAATFTSSSTVTNLVELLGDASGATSASAKNAATLLRGLAVVSIGPITSATCRTHGIHVDATASVFTLVGLVAALEAHFAARAAVGSVKKGPRR